MLVHSISYDFTRNGDLETSFVGTEGFGALSTVLGDDEEVQRQQMNEFVDSVLDNKVTDRMLSSNKIQQQRKEPWPMGDVDVPPPSSPRNMVIQAPPQQQQQQQQQEGRDDFGDVQNLRGRDGGREGWADEERREPAEGGEFREAQQQHQLQQRAPPPIQTFHHQQQTTPAQLPVHYTQMNAMHLQKAQNSYQMQQQNVMPMQIESGGTSIGANTRSTGGSRASKQSSLLSRLSKLSKKSKQSRQSQLSGSHSSQQKQVSESPPQQVVATPEMNVQHASNNFDPVYHPLRNQEQQMYQGEYQQQQYQQQQQEQACGPGQTFPTSPHGGRYDANQTILSGQTTIKTSKSLFSTSIAGKVKGKKKFSGFFKGGKNNKSGSSKRGEALDQARAEVKKAQEAAAAQQVIEELNRKYHLNTNNAGNNNSGQFESGGVAAAPNHGTHQFDSVNGSAPVPRIEVGQFGDDANNGGTDETVDTQYENGSISPTKPRSQSRTKSRKGHISSNNSICSSTRGVHRSVRGGTSAREMRREIRMAAEEIEVRKEAHATVMADVTSIASRGGQSRGSGSLKKSKQGSNSNAMAAMSTDDGNTINAIAPSLYQQSYSNMMLQQQAAAPAPASVSQQPGASTAVMMQVQQAQAESQQGQMKTDAPVQVPAQAPTPASQQQMRTTPGMMMSCGLSPYEDAPSQQLNPEADVASPRQLPQHWSITSPTSTRQEQQNVVTSPEQAQAEPRGTVTPLRQRLASPLRQRLASPVRSRNATTPTKQRAATTPLKQRATTPMKQRNATTPLKQRNATTPLKQRKAATPLKQRNATTPLKQRTATTPMKQRVASPTPERALSPKPAAQPQEGRQQEEAQATRHQTEEEEEEEEDGNGNEEEQGEGEEDEDDVPMLVDWRMLSDGGISGRVFGSRYFADGELIETAPVVSSGRIERDRNNLIKTANGKRFVLSAEDDTSTFMARMREKREQREKRERGKEKDDNEFIWGGFFDSICTMFNGENNALTSKLDSIAMNREPRRSTRTGRGRYGGGSARAGGAYSGSRAANRRAKKVNDDGVLVKIGGYDLSRGGDTENGIAQAPSEDFSGVPSFIAAALTGCTDADEDEAEELFVMAPNKIFMAKENAGGAAGNTNRGDAATSRRHDDAAGGHRKNLARSPAVTKPVKGKKKTRRAGLGRSMR